MFLTEHLRNSRKRQLSATIHAFSYAEPALDTTDASDRPPGRRISRRYPAVFASAAGLSGAAARWLSRSSRSRKSRSKSSILAENPFCINCLCRRAARASTLAVRNTLSVASGKITVPMSRPSATRPGGLRNARWRANQRRPQRWRMDGDRRGAVADFLRRECRVDTSTPSSCAQPSRKRDVQLADQLGQRVARRRRSMS